jgi:hypothetical protein
LKETGFEDAIKIADTSKLSLASATLGTSARNRLSIWVFGGITDRVNQDPSTHSLRFARS